MSMAMKYKAKKMATGGMADPEPTPAPKADEMTKSMKSAFHFAGGGEVKACKACGYAEGGLVNKAPEPEHDDSDMIGSIMAKRSGGPVANDTEKVNPDDMDAEYDDMVLDDNLESSYDAKNSGDEDGDEALDEEDDDVVDSVMKSRKKKDKNPQPA